MNPSPRTTSARALVVMGSTAARAHLVRVLEADADIVVVGEATSGADAVLRAVELRPDIIIVDLYLPDGGGRVVIAQIMARVPTPILVLSRTTDDDRSPSVVEALVAGALDALPQPRWWTPDLAGQLCRSVRLLRKVPVMRVPEGSRRPVTVAPSPHTQAAAHQTVAIAASTGGPSALAIVLSGLGGLASPVLVVQHLHPEFTSGLIAWMSRVSALPVELAQHGLDTRPGRVYVAPGGVHLRIAADGRLELDPAPVTTHRPSADELFLSVAKHVGAAATGVVLTGMGDDGAKGLLAIRQNGGRTLAQDEASSAVFGMPAAARRLGAVTDMLPPAGLARAIMHASRNGRR